VTAPGKAPPAVEFRRVCKAFGGAPVLRGVDLSVRSGETFTILGGSGSGKSVCLKHMIGLLRADSGSIRVGGRDVTRLPEEQWVAVRRDFGMVFQGAALFDSLTVYENVAYPLREHLSWEEERIAERVRSCLEAVGLAGVQPMLPSDLSGGMRKRVGVARAIALEPQIILYDEPTTGLDPANSRRIGELIRTLQERLRITSVVVTHEMELCFAVSDRVALLREGVLALEGSAEEMRGSEHPDMRAFIEGSFDPAPAAPGGSPLGGGAHGG
jgi:phospholipid/cholesterol/gamma-HCH transport system ATP-binding protein